MLAGKFGPIPLGEVVVDSSQTLGNRDVADRFEDAMALCRKPVCGPELGMRRLMERVLSSREMLRA